MKCIDEINKIYSISLQELTYGQLRDLSNGDDTQIGSLLMFYNRGTDRIYIIEGDNFTSVLKCVNKALMLSKEEIMALIKRFKAENNRIIFEVMLGVIKVRGQTKYRTDISKSPNSKFISLGDSIIQVGKIISVKKYSETSIDILTTGRGASVRKTYPTKVIRDFELQKIEKMLLQTS